MEGFLPQGWLFAALALAALMAVVLRRRAARKRFAVPADWHARLHALVPHAQMVPAELQPRYLQRVEQFLRDKRFVGCNGLAVTADMRVAVAGLACLLILRPQAGLFPLAKAILLYPDAFLVHDDAPDELGLVSENAVEQVGESWEGERVILSWADVQAALAGDQVNVVVHEFAHQLDDETPHAEGAPALADYSRWAEVMQREFSRLQRHRRPPVLDPYGAESPAEFFGVVTEAFFQRGAALSQHHPELYDLLRGFYLLDPAAHPQALPAMTP